MTAARAAASVIEQSETAPSAAAGGVDDGRRQPRYRSIAAALGKRIDDRTYPPGTFLPSESELAAEFGVTRMTVRQALAGLSARGLIERRHGHGTMVSPIHLRREAEVPYGLSAELNARGVSVGSRVLRFDRIRPPADARSDLWIGPRGSCFRLRRLRYADGVLIGLQESLIPEKYAPDLLSFDFNVESLTRILRERHGLSAAYAELTINALAADRPTAAALDVEPGTPILNSTRISYLEDGRPLERTIGWFPGSRYSYELRQGSGPAARTG